MDGGVNACIPVSKCVDDGTQYIKREQKSDAIHPKQTVQHTAAVTMIAVPANKTNIMMF